MSGRLLASRAASSQLRPYIRPTILTHRPTPRAYSLLTPHTNAAGLLRHHALPRLRHDTLSSPRFRSITQVPAVRLISFQRALPKLFVKFIRIPAAFGGATIAGLAYVNYKVQEAGNYTMGLINDGKAMASGLFASGKDAFGGVVSSIDDFEKPDWFTKMQQTVNDTMAGIKSKSKSGGESGGDGGEGKRPEEDPSGKKVAAAGVAAGAVFSAAGTEDDKQSAKDDQMMVLTRKMIEIRTILQKVGQTGALTLPSIVVIGSQSSGKSSVLEGIVGHEFLPKGSNMVTRRPIELTLVNTPDSNVEYGEFPALNLGKITDFSHIQRTLTDLNLAVPEKDCVSDDPIRLTIYSKNVPDLSLIDLPGYIQISAMDQPEELKSKIFQLCDKYIQPPNVILAVSAADVDLANSTALRASRRVDPRGERTIGVITKMDLVDPDRGANILRDKNYPLRLGYVGVVTKLPQSGGLFSRHINVLSAITKNENAYFGQHQQFAAGENGVTVGTYSLRRKLMEVLEATMAQSLQGTSDAIHQELEEASYEFKVQYNDRPLTAETYLAESLDSFKHSFKEFTELFGRPQVRMLLKQELDQRVLDILAQRYWNKPVPDLKKARLDEHPLAELTKVDPDELYWHRKLDGSSSALTKLGIGRLATNVVANALSTQMDQLIEASTFRSHPFAKKAIQDSTNQILNERFYATSDQVENCIKPYKFEIEVDDREWNHSRENAQRLLKDELKACEDSYKKLRDQIGAKKLSSAMSFVDKIRTGKAPEMQEGAEALGFSQAMLEKGREGIFLRDRADIIKMRMLAVKSKGCATKEGKYACPEIFMDVVAEKLTSTAVLFLNVELLSEFYYNFPRELDLRLGRHLSQAQIEAFAREDPKIRKHVDLQQRKQLLELALQKMDSLMALEKSKKATGDETSGRTAGRWGGFF
ncbi:hypothetical protein H072_8942 [Dactylellina haptotyla CBS 200.50]|uniref:dynamin GTPase n=1 Tax=Dactylellina haptotyla (strain CBS 200.50) TaxID=1284197 RepID=S8BDT2_DACHA|nr:hypothetical protein H072_8942 [Dactylellina haptotyla CBS 200.50]